MLTPPIQTAAEVHQQAVEAELRKALFWSSTVPGGSPKFERRFLFNPRDQSNTTDEIVRLVSSTLSPYLTAPVNVERNKLATRGIHVCGPADFRKASITAHQVELFQMSLGRLIRGHLGQSQTRYLARPGPVRYLELKSRHTPEGDLSRLISSVGIRAPKHLFPRNTEIRIAPQRNTLYGPVDEILVAVDLTAPPPFKRGELERLVSHRGDAGLSCKRVMCFPWTLAKERSLQNVSREVSDLLGVFLDPEGELVTEEQKRNFQASVSRQITFGIQTRIDTGRLPIVWFSSKLHPEGFLKGALSDAGIPAEKSCKLFPSHSEVTVKLDRDADGTGEFEISLDFPSTPKAK